VTNFASKNAPKMQGKVVCYRRREVLRGGSEKKSPRRGLKTHREAQGNKQPVSRQQERITGAGKTKEGRKPFRESGWFLRITGASLRLGKEKRFIKERWKRRLKEGESREGRGLLGRSGDFDMGPVSKGAKI